MSDHDFCGDLSLSRDFSSPWQARCFAIVKSLQDSDIITLSEWSETMGVLLDRNGKNSLDPEEYYAVWIEALFDLLDRKELVSARVTEAVEGAWLRAAARTAHGQPIELSEQDFDLKPLPPDVERILAAPR